MGAGLGGGSSDAVAALLGLNRLAERPLATGPLTEIAARLGSDCPLFLQEGPTLMRGRGEHIAPLPPPAATRLRGRRVLIFKPAFGISTPWAYGRMVARDRARRDFLTVREDITSRIYLPPTEAEARLKTWLASDRPAEALLYNNMERVAFEKFTALPALLTRIEQRFGVVARMSGSGSACFALLGEDTPAAPLTEAIRADWGASAFVTETRIL
jgi:4-diphosphocytidyl-2-C-methyl-D-erythritol kinase